MSKSKRSCSQSVSQWVSDRGKSRAVRWQLKKILSLEKFYTNIVTGVSDYYQVCTYPCHSQTPYTTFYFLTLKSDPRDLWPFRHQNDEETWPDQHLEILENFYNVWEFLTCFDNFMTFTFFVLFLTILNFLIIFDNSDNFWQFNNFDYCFYHFDNWKDIPGELWHFRTWFHNNLCYLTIKSDNMDSIRNSCDVFSK